MTANARMQAVLVVQRVMSAVTALSLLPLSLSPSLPLSVSPPPPDPSLRSADASQSFLCSVLQKLAAAAGNAAMHCSFNTPLLQNIANVATRFSEVACPAHAGFLF
ncbi:hypothetical protein ILYODFUR_001302 [Ilyodon furcidens]|uniref:Secreted protein n=1 Tax=Ilyodon furcidens TaxID=33524 RepID=A0ABV0T4C5_9TELE